MAIADIGWAALNTWYLNRLFLTSEYSNYLGDILCHICLFMILFLSRWLHSTLRGERYIILTTILVSVQCKIGTTTQLKTNLRLYNFFDKCLIGIFLPASTCVENLGFSSLNWVLPRNPGLSSLALIFLIFTVLPLNVANMSLCLKKLQPS